MKIHSTKEAATLGAFVSAYGKSGVGKTKLIETAPDPIILSAESGLLSLQEVDLPYIEINSIKDLEDAVKWCKSSTEAKKYQTISLDSISDIAEVVLIEGKKKYTDPRQAYGEMNDKVAEAIRDLRDLQGRHKYIIAKEKRLEDESTGSVTFTPSLPGKALMQDYPYFFDILLYYQYKKVGEKEERRLLTEGNSRINAKDRSGTLDKFEEPNLTVIFNKILGGQKHGSTTETS